MDTATAATKDETVELTTYLAIGPGYWAKADEAELALIYLLKMMPEIAAERVHHIQVFNVPDEWEFDGHSVIAKRLRSWPMMKITGKVQAKVKTAYHLIEDLWQDQPDQD